MDKKKQVIGIISARVQFDANKPRYSVGFKTGKYMTQKDRPRKRYSRYIDFE